MSKMPKRVVAAGVAAALCVLASCGKGDDPGATNAPAKEDAASSDAAAMPTEEQMAKQAEETRKALAQMSGGKEIKAVEGKELKAVLPETIGGAKRRSFESQHMNQMGMDISTTKASYDPEPAEGDAPPKPGFDVEIMDLGNLSGSMTMGFAAWSMTQYDKETDTGYEKTTKYKGFPAMEKYENEGKYGELQVFVAKRFVVKVAGHDATMEQIRAAVDAIDVSKIEALGK